MTTGRHTYWVTTGDIRRMNELHRAGVIKTEIARRLRIKYDTVRRYTPPGLASPAAELPPPGQHGKRKYRWVTTADIDAMLELYRDGWSLAEISRRLGYHLNTVRKYINHHVPPSQRRWPIKYGRARSTK
jgi:transposase